MFFLLGPEDALTFLYCGQEDPAKSERHSVVPVLGDDIYWALDVPVATR